MYTTYTPISTTDTNLIIPKLYREKKKENPPISKIDKQFCIYTCT